VVSNDTESLAAETQSLIRSSAGYVESLNATHGDDGTRYEMTLRVPVSTLDSAVNQLKSLATEVRSERRTSEDVTAQVVDLDARVRALELTEQQLEALLAESRSAGRDAQGIMAIFRELTTVREQRENIRGQLERIEDLVSLSKIQLQIVPLQSSPRLAFDWGFDESISNAVEMLQLSLKFLSTVVINAVVVVLPLVALVGMVSLAVIKARKVLVRVRSE
jgi:hypothetical protein